MSVVIRDNARGFTLVELAIVLVVIAFIMAAVLQGQKVYYNAKMNRIVEDMKGYRQYFLIYYQRWGMYPGDENDPNFPSGDTYEGNHNGLIDTSSETTNVWEDLSHALDVVRKGSPVRGGQYNFSSRDFGFGTRNYISVSNIFNKMAQAIDARHDDGAYDTGNVQSSAPYDGSDTLITLYWRL
ncbi:MAG: hypothetical protein DRG50_04750 [Deltaproteobacteria bacterium]|nr:MAG: hypothetical protein DRG50_04750 [Deltaproteobacteria bacterium]